MSTGEIIALIAAIAGPLASVVCVMINNRNTRKQMLETEAQIREETDKKQDKILKLSLRTTIQGIYAMYRGEHSIPQVVYEGMCQMYDTYVGMGGNSYIKALKAEMDAWDRY